VLTVTPLPITVTANDQTKVFGQPDPALTFTAPTVNGDVLNGALVRAPGETVPGSPYAITQGTVTTANNPNYAIIFVNGQLVITPAPLTIAADSKTRLYGDANPPLTATFTGLTNGDTTAAIPGVTLTTPATIASNVGDYAINAASGANPNYTITYVNGQLAITPAPLTIAADDKARLFGVPNPPFTATATGFKLGQTVTDLNGTLVFTTPATTSSPPSVYPIVPGGVSSGNYTITFVDGVLVVGQGAPPADQALVTAVGRSESDPTAGLRTVRAIDCLTVDRPGDRRVLSRCF
jgi:MBG domain (YGX type)